MRPEEAWFSSIALFLAGFALGPASRVLAPPGGGPPPPDPPPAAEVPLEPEAPSAEACAAWFQPAPPCAEPTVELRPPSIEECAALLQECSAGAGQEPVQQLAVSLAGPLLVEALRWLLAGLGRCRRARAVQPPPAPRPAPSVLPAGSRAHQQPRGSGVIR